MPEPTPLYSQTFDLPLGGLNLKPAYWQAVVLLLLVFLLVFSLARMRHMYLKWSFKSFLPAFFLGVLVAVVIEAFLIVSGRELLVEIVGMENLPKPINTFVNETRQELIKALGKEQICEATPSQASIESTLSNYEQLPDAQKETVKKIVCQ